MNGNNLLSPARIDGIGRGVLGLLVGRQPATTDSTNANQVLFFVVLAVVGLQVLGIARSIVLLRRWRARPARRPRGPLRVTARVVLPLLVSLAWALVCLVVLPVFLGGSLSLLLLTTPDFGWLLVASGTISLVWGVTRAILAVRTLRRYHAEPMVSVETETVSA